MNGVRGKERALAPKYIQVRGRDHPCIKNSKMIKKKPETEGYVSLTEHIRCTYIKNIQILATERESEMIATDQVFVVGNRLQSHHAARHGLQEEEEAQSARYSGFKTKHTIKENQKKHI